MLRRKVSQKALRLEPPPEAHPRVECSRWICRRGGSGSAPGCCQTRAVPSEVVSGNGGRPDPLSGFASQKGGYVRRDGNVELLAVNQDTGRGERQPVAKVGNARVVLHGAGNCIEAGCELRAAPENMPALRSVLDGRRHRVTVRREGIVVAPFHFHRTGLGNQGIHVQSFAQRDG